MFNIKVIVKIMGQLLAVEAAAMLVTLLVALGYGGPDVKSFLYSIGITLATGGILYLIGKNSSNKIAKREAYIIVTLAWTIFSLFGSLPFMIGGFIPSFTNAFFETMSGFTTTGSTILTNIESLPHGILFWRSMTQWLGGMGIIVLSLAILPALGIGNMQMIVADIPGTFSDKLHPRINRTIKNLLGIYLLFTALETILLYIGKMPLFDAVCHSFTTLSTGGFSTKQHNIAFFSSPYLQYVIIFFMFVAGTNFSLSYLAFNGKLKKIWANEEFRWYGFFIIFFTVVIALGLMRSTHTGFEHTFRESLFQVMSIISTTGFVSVNYLKWPALIAVFLFILFFFGASAGSTGGGIKIVRVVLLLKNSWYELRRLIHPNAVIPVRFNRRTVSDEIILNALAFFMIYVLVFFASVIIYTFVEPDLSSAIGAVASSLGNIGPGLGNLGPAASYFHVPAFGKWFLSFLMLLGRLELFTILILLTPSFWKS